MRQGVGGGQGQMELRPVASDERDAFDAFVGAHLHGDPVQGWGFAELRAQGGARAHRFYLVDQGRLVGSISLIARRAGRLGLLLQAPRGPVLDPARAPLWADLRRELRRTFPDAFALIASPRLEVTARRPPGALPRGTAGGSLTTLPRQAVEVPLSGDPERDLARVHRRCRVQIRRAAAHGIQVRPAAPEEQGLWLGMLRREGRGAALGAAPAELAELAQELAHWGQAQALLAERRGQVQAATLVLSLGRHAVCRRLGGPPDGRTRAAEYAAQWAALAWAERQGAERCDITGFLRPADETTAALARRWGAIERRYRPQVELPLRWLPYVGYRCGLHGAPRVPWPAAVAPR